VSDLLGRKIGPYEIIDKIGEGGMATVYRAYQVTLDRYVAVKVLAEWMAQDGEFVQRFRREALAAGGLRHPNILRIHDAGTFEGRHFIVMDYVPGGTLEDRVRRQTLPPEEAAALLAEIADALDYAHRRGIVHRDIKPTNILMDEEGHPQLADFGVAQAMDSGVRMTRAGDSIGTPEYMSPEQSQGERVDGRSDLYSLGVVLYRIVTGRVPLRSTTPAGTLYQIVHEPPPPPRQINPDIPPALETVILKALAKHPEDRYQTGKEMAEALLAARSGGAVLPAAGPTAAVVATTAKAQRGRTSAPPAATQPPTYIPAPAALPKVTPMRRSRSPVIGILATILALLILGLAALAAYLALPGIRPSPAPAVALVNGATLPPASPTVAPTIPPPTPSPAATAETIIIVATTTDAPAAEPTPSPSLSELPPDPTATPSPAPTSAPAPTATVAPTSKPAAAPVAAKASNVVLDFSDFGIWKRGNEPYGTFTQSTEQEHDGAPSAKLAYDIPAVANNYVVFTRVPNAPIPGQPPALSLWVYGDGSNQFLNAWIEDAQGEIRQFTFGRVAHTNSWQAMTLNLDTSAPWPQTHISGPDNGRLDYPIAFNSFVFDAEDPARTYQGTLFLGQMTVGSASGPAAPAPAAGLSPTFTPAAPASSASLTGHIVFAQGSSGSTDIMVLDAATGKTWMAHPAGRQPSVSPGGRVAFNGTGGGKDVLITVRLDGSEEKFLSVHPEDSYPNWSPTAKSLVYHSSQQGDGKNRLYILPDTANRQEPQHLQVNGADLLGEYPTWLANWRIAYSGCGYQWGRGDLCGVWSVNSDGSGDPVRLTMNSNDRTTDAQGGNLLYSSSAPGNWDVFSVPENGGAPRNLTNSPSQDFGATFSPDGSAIAFMSDRDGWGIWVMNADGSNPRKLTAAPGFGADWSNERLSWGP
jgi:eukaryotic-like serine/threonine-protein kinase